MKSLFECKTFDELCALPRDHYDVSNFTIMTDGVSVWISEQSERQSCRQEIHVPKGIFDQLIRKYITPDIEQRSKRNV